MAELSSRDEAIVITIEDLTDQHPLSLCIADQLTLNASLISSSESVSFIFLAIIVRNSALNQHSRMPCGFVRAAPGKSIVPLLSASTSLIMSCSSDSEGFWPSDRMTVPSSLVVICPVCLSISNNSVYACPVCDPVCDPILSTIGSRSNLCRNREEAKSPAPYGGFRKCIRVLTIAVFVLLRQYYVSSRFRLRAFPLSCGRFQG